MEQVNSKWEGFELDEQNKSGFLTVQHGIFLDNGPISNRSFQITSGKEIKMSEPNYQPENHHDTDKHIKQEQNPQGDTGKVQKDHRGGGEGGSKGGNVGPNTGIGGGQGTNGGVGTNGSRQGS